MGIAGVLVVIATVLAGCAGGGTETPDGAVPDDGASDVPGVLLPPPPPVLGRQLSRAGRAMVKRALIGAFADEATRAATRDAYDRAPDPAGWKAAPLSASVTVGDELATNLAVFDAIDKGLMVPNQTLAGCGNALRYARPPGTQSYQGAVEIFADDQLYIDTSKALCGAYLALEIELASAGTFVHTTCGGRTPGDDVVDVTYSVLASGVDALDPANQLAGRIRDAVSPHGDITDTFPFLGPPHQEP
jgi:hypothetical protein